MTYPTGTADTVSWIREATPVGLSIGAAIPPGFASYATIVIPGGPAARRHDLAILDALEQHSPQSRWWLGYLDTGVDAISVRGVRTVPVYGGWQYALVCAGPQEARSWRDDAAHRTLPDLIFPADRSWLVSTLWDDDWRCIGGPESLVGSMVASADLDTRVVDFRQDATPPGHVAR